MGRILIVALFIVSSISLFAQKPVSHQDMKWDLKPEYSDEFNSGTLNSSKWNTDVRDWGTWSWEPENAYTSETDLIIRMQQKEHTRKVAGADKKFYFTSGIAQISDEITYGYFETRIKASEKGQGTCPAFWIYSVGQPDPTEEGGVKYCEIDVIEIFQIPNNYQRLEMNLHTRILENGVLTWKRPGQGDTELCHNSWDAPWDPRDEYHTYGVLNRPDSIFWYVDGVQRGAKKNHYWHLPMHVTVSMGLRTPYEKYIDGVRTVMPFPESSPEPGFPTEMFCDYVRVWEAPPQIIVDRETYTSNEFPVTKPFIFDLYYDAGTGHLVSAESWGGVKVTLVEKNAEGVIQKQWAATDANTVGMQAGQAKVEFDISNLVPSDELTEGHYYEIIPVFRTTKDDSDVYLDEPLKEIKIVKQDVGIDDEFLPTLKLYPNPASTSITIEGFEGLAGSLSIFDTRGSVHYKNEVSPMSEQYTLTIASLIDGVYFLSFESDRGHKVLKFIKCSTINS